MPKIVYHPAFTQVYTSDPAAEAGRIEAILDVLQGRGEWIKPDPADLEQICLAHTPAHVDYVRRKGLFDIAALAAGGALCAARIGLKEPAFALIRPPGHHASAGNSWGFCFFNNNPSANSREEYLKEVRSALTDLEADMIGVSAGFDYHQEDWGGLLATEDYRTIGGLVREAARTAQGGCFAILEGGYNHQVLGQNAAALLEGMGSGE